MATKKEDRSTWIVGGTTMLGVGIGFLLLPMNALYFVGSICIGIGVGLAFVSLRHKN